MAVRMVIKASVQMRTRVMECHFTYTFLTDLLDDKDVDAVYIGVISRLNENFGWSDIFDLDPTFAAA